MQSQLYRKASPHKPSPYLISKLRNYEDIHRRCGPNSRAYDRSMRKIVRSKNKGAAATLCKYLIWTPANGLGNQMISMAATFLYAMLTDRVMLVKFDKDKQGLFCEPFLNSTWVLPEKSPFWNEKHIETYQIMLEKDGIVLAIQRMIYHQFCLLIYSTPSVSLRNFFTVTIVNIFFGKFLC